MTGPSLPDGASPPADPPPPRADERLRWGRVGATSAVCLLILLGALGAARAIMAARPRPPRQAPPREGGVAVRVFEVGSREVRPELEALGRARPRRRVAVAAQVAGQVVAIDPDLEDGRVLGAPPPEDVAEGRAAPQVVVTIDPTDHQHELDRTSAQLDQARAEHARLEAQRRHLDERIALTAAMLAVEEAELARIEGMLGGGVRTERERDVARTAVLRGRDAQVQLRMTREQLGPQLDQALGRMREVESLVAAARTRLERTRIALPWRGLVTGVAVEAHQLVAPGQVLFELWDVERVEVPVALALDDAYLLAPTLGRERAGVAAEPRTVTVRYEGQADLPPWEGVLRRFEPVDGDTQTVKAVIEVANLPGRAPLLPGVFCRVTLAADPVRTEAAIPLEALQERDRVYLVRDGALAVVEVRPGRILGPWVLVEGLAPGDRVIVSRLERAVHGLPVTVLDAAETGS